MQEFLHINKRLFWAWVTYLYNFLIKDKTILTFLWETTYSWVRILVDYIHLYFFWYNSLQNKLEEHIIILISLSIDNK